MTILTTTSRPILMTGSMVLATLRQQNPKTQTRRVVIPTKTEPRVPPLHVEPWLIDGEQTLGEDGRLAWVGTHPDYPTGAKWFTCPYGDPGDRLWVREILRRHGEQWFYAADGAPVLVEYAQRAPMAAWAHHRERNYCPSIHMPKWAGRIDLEILAVRVEQVQGISEADAKAEGAPVGSYERETPDGLETVPTAYRAGFRALWEGINGRRGFGWQANPWVWVVEFRRVQP